VGFLIANLECVTAFFAGGPHLRRGARETTAASMPNKEEKARRVKDAMARCASVPYRYVRLSTMMRVRVAVLHACSSIPLARDTLCDEHDDTTGAAAAAAKSHDDAVRLMDPNWYSWRALKAALQAVSAGIEGFEPEGVSQLVSEEEIVCHLEENAAHLKRMGICTLEAAQKIDVCGKDENGTLAAWRMLIPVPIDYDHADEAMLQRTRKLVHDALSEASRWMQRSAALDLMNGTSSSERASHERYVQRFRQSLERGAEEHFKRRREAQDQKATLANSFKHFPEEQSVVPTCTGHTALPMSRGRMLLVGGGNKYAYSDAHEIKVYDHTTQVRQVFFVGLFLPSGPAVLHCFLFSFLFLFHEHLFQLF
jgi:hypothetical protein